MIKRELKVGDTIMHGGALMVIKGMRLVTPCEPMFVTTTSHSGSVLLLLEDQDQEDAPFPDGDWTKVATLTPDEFDAFTKKHNITWKEM